MVIVLKLNLNYAIVSKSTLQIFQNLSGLQQDILLYFTSFYKPKIFLFMTIQQVITNEQKINSIEFLKEKNLAGFEEFYSDSVVIIQDDGTDFTGKEACRAMEEGFNSSIISITTKELLSSVVMPSFDPEYEFCVIATWNYDLMTSMYPIKGLQTSIGFWKDGMI